MKSPSFCTAWASICPKNELLDQCEGLKLLDNPVKDSCDLVHIEQTLSLPDIRSGMMIEDYTQSLLSAICNQIDSKDLTSALSMKKDFKDYRIVDTKESVTESLYSNLNESELSTSINDSTLPNMIEYEYLETNEYASSVLRSEIVAEEVSTPVFATDEELDLLVGLKSDVDDSKVLVKKILAKNSTVLYGHQKEFEHYRRIIQALNAMLKKAEMDNDLLSIDDLNELKEEIIFLQSIKSVENKTSGYFGWFQQVTGMPAEEILGIVLFGNSLLLVIQTCVTLVSTLQNCRKTSQASDV